MRSYDKYDTKIHRHLYNDDLQEQKKKLENIYRHNDNDYKNVKRGMLEQNQQMLNKHWMDKYKEKENIKVMGIDSKHMTEEIKEKERQENEIRKYNQMNYKNILDGQIKSKVNYPVPITLEPHLANRYHDTNTNENNQSKINL